jgi:hypothetical protein
MQRLLNSISTWRDVSTHSAPVLRVEKPDNASASNTFRTALPTFKGGITPQTLVVGFTNDLAAGSSETLTLSRCAENAQFDAVQLAKREFVFVDLRRLLRAGNLVPPNPDTPFGMAEFEVFDTPIVEGTSVHVTHEDAVTEEIGGGVVNIHLRAVVTGTTVPVWVSLAQMTPRRSVIVPLAAIMQLLVDGEPVVFKDAAMERKLVSRCVFVWQWWRETAATAINVTAKTTGMVTPASLSTACDTADSVCWIALAFKAPSALRAHVFALVCPYFTWHSKSKHVSGVPVYMEELMVEENDCVCSPKGKVARERELGKDLLSVADAGEGSSTSATGEHGENTDAKFVFLGRGGEVPVLDGRAFVGCAAKGVFGTEETTDNYGANAIWIFGGPFTLASDDPRVAAGACCSFVQLMTTTFGKVPVNMVEREKMSAKKSSAGAGSGSGSGSGSGTSAAADRHFTVNVVIKLPDGADLFSEYDKAVVSARRFLRKKLPMEIDRVALLKQPVFFESAPNIPVWEPARVEVLASRVSASTTAELALPWMFTHFPGFHWAVVKVASNIKASRCIGADLALRLPDIQAAVANVVHNTPRDISRQTLGGLAAKMTWTPRELLSRLGALDGALGSTSPWRWWLTSALENDGVCDACAPKFRTPSSAYAFGFAVDNSADTGAMWALRTPADMELVVNPVAAVDVGVMKTVSTFKDGVDARDGFGPFVFVAVHGSDAQALRCVELMHTDGFSVVFNMQYGADDGVWDTKPSTQFLGWRYLVFMRGA